MLNSGRSLEEDVLLVPVEPVLSVLEELLVVLPVPELLEEAVLLEESVFEELLPVEPVLSVLEEVLPVEPVLSVLEEVPVVLVLSVLEEVLLLLVVLLPEVVVFFS